VVGLATEIVQQQ